MIQEIQGFYEYNPFACIMFVLMLIFISMGILVIIAGIVVQYKVIIETVVQRTLGFPFFCGIAFVGASIMFVKWIINYIRFGGESIAYTDKMNRKTIQDVFVKLNEMQQREQS